MKRPVQPSVRETAFNCPHCGAFTTQTWFDLYASEVDSKERLPFVPTNEDKERFSETAELDPEDMRGMLEWFDKILAGEVLVGNERSNHYPHSVNNLHLSKCYNCHKVAVWVYDRLVFPSNQAGPQPNADLPDDIQHDFNEARAIVDSSPRGAAALLRLCIQKLCVHLGQPGKRIDDDIAALVKNGLNPTVQRSLDIVRVIGNESVHPGEMNMRDDRDTALRLFDLINAIADQMITHPKTVDAMYAKLPEGKRKAIEGRDKK